jgi:hypothetical protein
MCWKRQWLEDGYSAIDDDGHVTISRATNLKRNPKTVTYYGTKMKSE